MQSPLDDVRPVTEAQKLLLSVLEFYIYRTKTLNDFTPQEQQRIRSHYRFCGTKNASEAVAVSGGNK